MKALALPLTRPVATGAAYLALLILGVSATRNLPLGLAPDVDLPSLSVSFNWPHASSQEIEALVTSRAEAEVHELRGVEEVSSRSGEGWSVIDVSFARGTDMDLTEVFLRERLAALQTELPAELQPPSITHTLPRGMEGGDFLVVEASGPFTAERLREVLDDEVVPRLLAVRGVAGAEVYGGSSREIRVDLDRDALERGLVTTSSLGHTLDGIGGSRSLGATRRGDVVMPTVLTLPPPEASSVEGALLRSGSSRGVRLGEVARVRDGYAEPVRLSRINGRPSVQLVVNREPGSNVVHVAEEALAQIDDVRVHLPEGITFETLYDQSERVRDELAVLIERSGMGIVAIFLVMVLFHARLRSPLVVLVSVLFSGLGTFLLFRISGVGINLVTLSGLALALGMAVDNSIVILENVHQRSHGRVGLLRLRTLAATREVLSPLVASTLATAVVLVPFLYLSGDLRDYYLPFALAVIASLTASVATAVTLTPLLARWALVEPPLRLPRWLAARALARTNAAAGRGVLGALEQSLEFLLRRPWVPVTAGALLFAGSVWVFATQVSRGSIFPSDNDTFLRVSVEFPPGAEIEQVDDLLRKFETLVLEHPFYAKHYVKQVATHVRERAGVVIVRFDPGVARTSVPEALRDDATMLAATISGVAISVSGRGPGYSSGGANVSPSYQLAIKGPDYPTLVSLAEDLGTRLEHNPRVANVDLNLTGSFIQGATELVIAPDRARMADLGMSMADLVDVVRPAVASEVASRALRGSDGELEARVRYAGVDALTPIALLNTFARVEGRPPFPLGEVVDIQERPVQSTIERHDQQYEKRIGFEYKGPRRAGDRFMESMVENIALPSGYSVDEGFGTFLTNDEERDIYVALALAFALVYLVSAALFESLLLPFVAILSVPLGLVGVAAVFWAMGEPFDRTAYIGLILLIGIAINNGLILVHRMGEIYRRTGDAVRAARGAVSERVRPIVMTTATSVAGVVPLIWNVDPNAAAGWRALALASIGGLTASTLFALTVTPPLFVLMRGPRRRAWPAPSFATFASRTRGG